jgi:hypothetical protein
MHVQAWALDGRRRDDGQHSSEWASAAEMTDRTLVSGQATNTDLTNHFGQ